MNPSPTDAPARAGARTVKVPDDRDGQRLDNFLLGQLKGAPRSLVYKLVRSGQVRVNGGRAKAERKLEAGDEVRIPPVRLEGESERGTPAPGLLQRIEAAIVFEDARLLALDKPSGVASHGGMLSVGANVSATKVSGNIVVNMTPLTASTDRMAEPTQMPSQIIENPNSSSRLKPSAVSSGPLCGAQPIASPVTAMTQMPMLEWIRLETLRPTRIE